MNSKGHLITSLIKSGLRIAGCVFAIKMNSIIPIASAFFTAELFGIMEELVDKR